MTSWSKGFKPYPLSRLCRPPKSLSTQSTTSPKLSLGFLSAGVTAPGKTLLVGVALEVGIVTGAYLRAFATATYPEGYNPNVFRGVNP